VWQALPQAVRSAAYQEFAAPAMMLAVCGLAALGFESLIAARGRLGVALALVAAAMDPVTSAWRSWMVALPAGRFPVITHEVFEESTESPKAARSAVAGAAPPGRLETYRDSLHWMSHAPVLGIATPNGNDPLAPERVLEVRRLYASMNDWERTGEARWIPSAVMNLLNVRSLVSWEDDGEAPPSEHYRLIAAVHGHKFWDNREALPRFFLAGKTESAGSLRESLQWLTRPDFNPRETAIVEGRQIATDGLTGGRIRVLSYQPERVELEYESEGAAVLVSSETAHPGWRARLDGREIPLLLVNGAFRGAAAPPGRHRVEMVYRPDSLRWGAAISLLAAAAMFIARRRQG
jgi:hypothetical protein